MKTKITKRNKTQERQEMQMKKKQLLTTNQPMPSPFPNRSPPTSFPPSLYTEHDVIWNGISLWSAGVR